MNNTTIPLPLYPQWPEKLNVDQIIVGVFWQGFLQKNSNPSSQLTAHTFKNWLLSNHSSLTIFQVRKNKSLCNSYNPNKPWVTGLRDSHSQNFPTDSLDWWDVDNSKRSGALERCTSSFLVQSSRCRSNSFCCSNNFSRSWLFSFCTCFNSSWQFWMAARSDYRCYSCSLKLWFSLSFSSPSLRPISMDFFRASISTSLLILSFIA